MLHIPGTPDEASATTSSAAETEVTLDRSRTRNCSERAPTVIDGPVESSTTICTWMVSFGFKRLKENARGGSFVSTVQWIPGAAVIS